jgi:organic radical activating enzyme
MGRGFISEIFASFQGEGLFAGQRHLFVRFSGCNLRCAYCDTPGSLEREGEYVVHLPHSAPRCGPNPVSEAVLSELVVPFGEAGGAIDAIAITGGEPLMQASFLASWLRQAALPMPVLLETSGMLPDALAKVIDQVSIVSMDIKLPSNTGERPFWEEHTRFARLARKKTLYAKVLVDRNTDAGELERAFELLAEVGRNIPVFLQPITPVAGPWQVDQERLVKWHASARKHLSNVRVLPQIHRLMGIP